MEELNLISQGFEAVQNPNFSRFLLITKSFWTWGALLIAVAAAFGSLLKRVKLVILRHHRGKSVNLQPPSYESETDFSDAESESPSDESSDGEEDSSGNFSDDEGQNRKSGFCFSWRPEELVRAWDGDLRRSSEIVRSFFSGIQISPAVEVTAAAEEDSGQVAVRAWDARVGRRFPAAVAGWRARGVRRVAGVSAGGDNRVYVGDDSGKVTFVDWRNVRSPVVTWWESDGF
ncbi:hypothetical protein QJS04_geneDACA003030 [Acorus gramineus]|uniref:Uncharacterized protein n=1 Tax=Acorus gramineus TaxID=55184 RepID=A0AAV9BXL7_ACOGR|nr:hypothetical protein QJS04_geneDACA003030 [Acorus gramineus]